MTGIVVVVGLVALALLLRALASRGESAGLPDPSRPGTATGAPRSDDVAGLLRAGRKIDAIKALRAETGLGLAEAKEAVEAMQRELSAS